MNLKWKKISVRRLPIGRYRSFLRKRYRLPNGHIDNFFILQQLRVVAALVVTADRYIILAKQFRPGLDKILWELPGGARDKQETSRQAIAREVMEETGYRGRIHYLGSSTNDAWSTLWRDHYLITNAIKVGPPKPDLTEITAVARVTRKKLRQLMTAGKMSDIETAYRGLEMLGKLYK